MKRLAIFFGKMLSTVFVPYPSAQLQVLSNVFAVRNLGAGEVRIFNR